MDNSNNIEQGGQDVVNLRDLLVKYLKKWYWFVFAVLITSIVAVFYLKSTVNKYNVQTIIMLRNDNNSAGGDQMMMLENLGLFNSSKALEDEIQVLNSHKIIGQAIDSLDLNTEYFIKDGLKYVEKYGDIPIKLITPQNYADTLKHLIKIVLKQKAGAHIVNFEYGDFKETYKLSNIQETFKTPAGDLKFQVLKANTDFKKTKILVFPKKNLVAMYAGKLQAGAVNKLSTNAIRISMVESNVKKAEDFLNKLVELYNLDAITDKNIIATNTAKFLNERLDIITQELFNVESDVEKYKKSNGITDITSEAGIYLQSSNEYGKRIVDLETQLKLMQYVEAQLKGNKSQHNLLPANIGIEDKGLVDLILSYNTAVMDKMKLTKTTNDNNPVLIDLNEQIDALRSNIIGSIYNIRGGLTISKNNILNKESEFTSRIRAVPTQERQFLEIKRQQEIKQNLYLFLSQKREENALTLASTAPAARTVDKAYASLLPVSPKRSMIYLVALILGILIPFLFIYLKDLINNKIEDVKEFKKTIKAPYLGNICISREAERVVVSEGKVTPIVEMFRLIRTNLQFMTASKKSPAILVTSTISGEGKSFISINLAMSFALMKKKVVLIGMDIRNPMLGEYLHIPKKNGLTLYLSDESFQLSDVLVPSGFHKYLDVIPAGPVPPNPAELLMSHRLEEMIAKLKEEYDYLIIDSAPIGVVSDTYLLNRVVDNSVFVARQNYTSNDSCQLINDIYDQKKLNDMGVIINGTDSNSSYGYGYGYGSDYRKKQIKKAIPKLTFGDRINDILYNIFNK